MTVRGADGAELISKRFTGEEEGSGSAMKPKVRNAEVVASLWPQILRGWIEDPEVAAALR